MSNAAIKAQQHHLAMSSSKSSSSSSIPKPSPREKEKANLEFIANIQAELRKRFYGPTSEAPITPNQVSETILVRTDSTPFLIETPAVEITPAAEDGAFKPNQPSKNIRLPAADCTQSRMPAVPASQSKIIPPIAGQNSKMPTKPNQASTNDSHSSADRLAAENHRPPQGNTVDSKLIIIDVLGTVGMKSRPTAKPGRILMPPPSPRARRVCYPEGLDCTTNREAISPS